MKDIVALGKKPENDYKKFNENKNPIVILYELEGCGHCIAIEKPWAKAMKKLKAHKDVKDYMDCANAIFYYEEKNPDGTIKVRKAPGKKSCYNHLPEQLRDISGFPTIQIIKNCTVLEEFTRDRTEESIIQFVVDFVNAHPELKTSEPAKPANPAKPVKSKITNPAKPKKPAK